MLMQNRLCRLELNFNNVDDSRFGHFQFFIPPYAGEDSRHFIRRVLALTALAEFQPKISPEHLLHKQPDLQVGDDQSITIWAQVDRPDEKHLARACHRSQIVLLCLEREAHSKASELRFHPELISVQFDSTLLADIETWLNPVMRWSAWRDGQQVQLTNGDHLQQFDFPYHHVMQRLRFAY